MRIIQEKVTPEFKKWVGYCEKSKKDQLGSYDNPEHYKANAGDGNYTVFADLYRQKTGINVQGQPWCDSFIDTVFIHLFGVDKARALLGGFSAYTPTSANYYKQMGRYHKEPQEGDQIFFHNGTRIYHTGYVYSVKDGIVYTVEGNTSSSKILENEGGCVAYKQYPIGWSSGKKRIDGYGRPDYSLVETYLALNLGWLPVGGRTDPEVVNFAGRIKYMVMPALVLGISMTAGVMRYARSSMLDTMNKDYIKTARSKGLPEWRVNLVHGFRVSLTPVIVLVGFRLPTLIAGSVVIETVFQWPGIGSAFNTAVRSQNYNLVMMLALLFVFMTLFASTLVDILTAALDPRVKLNG